MRSPAIGRKRKGPPWICFSSWEILWGQGQTPIKEVLQLMKKEKWTFPAEVELEYKIPEGSDAVAEVKKCVQYCKEALA